MWVFGSSHGVCPTKLHNLVSSLEYLVSNRRRVLLGGIRLGGSATSVADEAREPHISTGLPRSLASRATPARPCRSCRAARLPAPRALGRGTALARWLRVLAAACACRSRRAARRCCHAHPPAPCALLRSTALARWAPAPRARVLAAVCACRSRRAGPQVPPKSCPSGFSIYIAFPNINISYVSIFILVKTMYIKKRE